MTTIQAFTVDGTQRVLVEVEDDDSEVDDESVGIGPVSRGSHAKPSSFEESLHSVRSAAFAALRTFREGVGPDEVKLVFAVKMTTEMNAIIARSAYEGNLGVELVWRPPRTRAPRAHWAARRSRCPTRTRPRC